VHETGNVRKTQFPTRAPPGEQVYAPSLDEKKIKIKKGNLSNINIKIEIL
jgi:hypothetical protein